MVGRTTDTVTGTVNALRFKGKRDIHSAYSDENLAIVNLIHYATNCQWGRKALTSSIHEIRASSLNT
jgi:hypothetical protein